MKKRIIPDPVLMCITILAIIGFQVYWLKDNFQREKKALQIKTNSVFQETMQKLQASKLKLPASLLDSTHKSKIFINGNINQLNVNSGNKNGKQIITMMNAITTKLHDSLKTDTSNNSSVVIRVSGTANGVKNTSPLTFRRYLDTNNHVYKFLFGMDTLQNLIKIPEVNTLYAAALKKEKVDVPFIISKSKDTLINDDASNVTIGFVHPVTFHVALQNTASYLLKKLTLPIFFSLFLIGATIFSFLLLYRNLVRQQRLAEIKNEFISNMTHELKTPIATVSVAVEALKNFNAMHDPEKTKEYLDISGNELQRLSLLVDKVLKLSMFEKKQIELNKENFDLKELIREVINSMKLQFEKNNAIVNFDTDGDNFIINADKLHITSVIYNLVDNALKYSFTKAKIDVQLSQKEKFLEIKVSDNGIGIAPEYRKKIFDKFFRVPTGNKHAVKGYGLGLSYVSEIVDRHQGSITVETEIGKGSSFTVILPSQSS